MLTACGGVWVWPSCFAQITGGFSGRVETEEEVHTVMQMVLNHLCSLRELIQSRIVVSVEANQPLVADTVEQAAAKWGQINRRPVLFHGEWVRTQSVDVTELPAAMLRPSFGTGGAGGAGGAAMVERHLARRTTNTTKVSAALQLRESLRRGGVRFHRSLKIETLDGTVAESVAITTFLRGLRAQLGAFVFERTSTGKVTVHGKGPNHKRNDDRVLAAMFLNSMVNGLDAATLALFRE